MPFTEIVTKTLACIPAPTEVAHCIKKKFNLLPTIALEKEFYVENTTSATPRFFDSQIIENSFIDEPLFEKIAAESGERQFEFSTRPTSDLLQLPNSAEKIEQRLNHIAQQHKAWLNWQTMPKLKQPGNGIHIHVSLHDNYGRNVLQKVNSTSNSESQAMLYSIGGLLETLPYLMLAFAPTPACYQRYIEPPFPKIFFSPTRISWGANNRSTAIRIPTSTTAPATRRIEHRVAGGSARIDQAIAAVLIGIYYGLINSRPPQYPKTYGLPSNPLLDLPKLPIQLDDALYNFVNQGKLLCSLPLKNI